MRFAAGLLAGLALCAAPGAGAARIPFRDVPVSYDLQGESLKDFLQRLFDDAGIAVVLSAEVQNQPGTLNGPRQGSAASVFKSIADSNGLVAYYDGSVTYVYKNRELGTRYLQIDPSRVESLRQASGKFGLGDANDSMELRGDSGLVSIAGTPRYIEQMVQLGTALGRAEPKAALPPSQHVTPMALHFIALKYAWAADTSFNVGDQQTVVPGVATIIKQLLGQSDSGGGSSRGSASAGGLRGRGLAALGDRIASASGQSGSGTSMAGAGDYALPQQSLQTAPQSGSYAALMDGGNTPRIVADPYRNAVIIRDLPERMPMYDQLVQQLDVESQIIQLDATIIDIDKTKAQQIGVNWGYVNGGTSVLFGGGLSPVDAMGNLAGLQVGAVVGNTAQFLSRVNALEQDGVTDIVQRPQVVTLNDVEAVIESTQSVYVPVAGAFDEDLYGIVAGTVLRVTPHMIVDNGRQRIRLLVTIEDGNVQVTSQTTTSTTGTTLNQAVPMVSRNAVNTQAVIDVGQGLLLGGLNRREDDHNTTKIPWLGDVPLIGHLFRADSIKRDQTERLFLIAPHIVTASAGAVTAPAMPEAVPAPMPAPQPAPALKPQARGPAAADPATVPDTAAEATPPAPPAGAAAAPASAAVAPAAAPVSAAAPVAPPVAAPPAMEAAPVDSADIAPVPVAVPVITVPTRDAATRSSKVPTVMVTDAPATAPASAGAPAN